MTDNTITPSAYNELGSELRTDVDALNHRVDALVDAVDQHTTTLDHLTAAGNSNIKIIGDVLASINSLRQHLKALEPDD